KTGTRPGTAQRSRNPPDTAALNGAVGGNLPPSGGRGRQLTRYDRFAVLPLFIHAAQPKPIVEKAVQLLANHPRCVCAAVPDTDGRQYSFVLRSPSSTP
ncbi:hypothetical protein ABZ467_38800, partial [Streptomyces sp. NPDC005727]